MFVCLVENIICCKKNGKNWQNVEKMAKIALFWRKNRKKWRISAVFWTKSGCFWCLRPFLPRGIVEFCGARYGGMTIQAVCSVNDSPFHEAELYSPCPVFFVICKKHLCEFAICGKITENQERMKCRCLTNLQ